jgi:hypothetical protein
MTAGAVILFVWLQNFNGPLTSRCHISAMDRHIVSRGEERKAVDLSARCRTFSGLRDQAYITNISTQGCCVKCQGLLFDVGMRLVMQIEGMEGIVGLVRWVSRQQAGVEFDAPLYAPIVEHLTQLHPGRVPSRVARVGD